MKISRCAFVLAPFLLLGCQGIGHEAADSPVVRQMKVNGVDLAYVEDGRGQTVVFVHGASGDLRTWGGVRPSISPRYRYVAYSMRYHHPNVWADDGRNYSFNQHVEDLAAFIRALNVGKVHLVGNSYSGRMAGVLALKYPELVRSVVLGSPSLATSGSSEEKAALAAFRADMGKVSAAAKAGDSHRAAVSLFDAVNQPSTFDKASPAVQKGWLDNAKTIAPMFAAPAAPPISCEALAAVKVPVMVIGGALQRASYRMTNEALLRCLPPGTRYVELPNAHHIWPAENPRDGAQAILAFIAGH
jgi:pimeloyl-ACP methyl ester carboxylesterase